MAEKKSSSVGKAPKTKNTPAKPKGAATKKAAAAAAPAQKPLPSGQMAARGAGFAQKFQMAKAAQETPLIFWLQLMFLSSFVIFGSSVILWVCRLLYVSLKYHDTPSASMGIALVAIPVFVVLVSVYNYVFWGIILDSGKPSHQS